MKTPLSFFTLCLIALGTHSLATAQDIKPLAAVAAATPTPTIKPLWTCTLTNAISFQDGATTNWATGSSQGVSYMVDFLGNAAVPIIDQAGYLNILWISSKGQLLGIIKTAFVFGNLVLPYLLNVSSSAIYTYDVEGDADTNGTPYQYVKYTLKGKSISKTPFFTGQDMTSTGQIYDPLPSLGIIGISATNASGTPTAFSFYKY